MFIVVLLSGVLFGSGMSCAQSNEPDNQMNVDIKLFSGGAYLRVTNNNDFPLKNLKLQLSANSSSSSFILENGMLQPSSTSTYSLFNFKNTVGKGFNYSEMDLLGINMYAETLEGETLTCEFVSGMSYTQTQMNVDMQLIADGGALRVINNNTFLLKNIKYELSANISSELFTRRDSTLFPRSTTTYSVYNFTNIYGEGFNFRERELLGLSMYAETVEGDILTAEWDFR